MDSTSIVLFIIFFRILKMQWSNIQEVIYYFLKNKEGKLLPNAQLYGTNKIGPQLQEILLKNT